MYATKAKEKKGIILNIHTGMVSGSRDIDLQADLGIDVQSLPKGARKVWKEDIYPKSFLSKYKEIQRHADNDLNKWGAKCELGYFHTRRKASEVLSKLKVHSANWEAQFAEDALKFDAVKEQRLTEIRAEADKEGLPQTDIDRLVDAVKALQPSWDEIELRFGFSYTCTPVYLDDQDFDSDFYEDQKNSVTAIYNSVMGVLIQEVCSSAASILKNLSVMESKKSSASEFRIHARTHDSIIGLKEKLHELSFMHANIRLLVEDMQVFLEQFEDVRGTALRGTSYAVFKEAIVALSDQHEVVAKLSAGERFLVELNVEKRRTALEAEIAEEAAKSQPVVEPTVESLQVTPAPVIQQQANEPEAVDSPEVAPATVDAFANWL